MSFSVRRNASKLLVTIAFFLLVQNGFVSPFRSRSVLGQGPSANRDTGLEMLREIKKDLKDNYYDPEFHGINLEEHFKTAERKIKETKSTAQIFGILGQVLIDFNDSHTGFIPPTLVTSVDYGWRLQMFGDKAYIVAVKPASDAAAKGLKVGDEVHSVDGFQLTRTNLWEFEYSYFVLTPALRTTVAVRDAQGSVRQIEIASKIIEEAPPRAYSPVIILTPRPTPPKTTPLYYEADKQTIITKLPNFEVSDKEVDEMIKRCSKYQNLILDLRGNPGGLVKAVQRMVGHFFDGDLKIADAKGRKESRAVIAKTRGDKVFKGRLIVLVDSDSSSAAEVFARVVQLEKRGVVIGDRTSGKVMTSVILGHPIGFRNLYPTGFFGVSVTIEDVFMSDGKSLEKLGVTPDEVIIPTGQQIASRQDPVLARAASLFDITLDPKKAGTLFPSGTDTERVNKKKPEE